MKVLLINKYLYPKGGDAVSTLNTGKSLLSKGHKIIFWGMQDPLNPEYQYKNFFVSQVDLNNPSGFKERIKITLNMLYSLEAKKKIEAVIKAEKPDIAHLNNFAHQISPSILHVFKKYNIPTIMTMHDYKLVCPTYNMISDGKPCEMCRKGKYYRCLLSKCTKNSYPKSLLNTIEMYLHHNILHIYDIVDVFISPSQFLLSELRDMGFRRKMKYLPNFVEIGDFKPQYNSTEESIIYFGRLSREKGLSTLIDAVGGLKVKLKLVGEGPLKADLESKVRNRNSDNVEFLGYKAGKELKNEIRNSMFVVLPSECYENSPMTIIEGFALGKPAVGARIGGIPELVKDNETGLTFQPGNAEDLRSKIECLVKSPEKIVEMGKNARAFIEKDLNAEKHYKSLMQIYEYAIAKHKV